jgi:hypothetical protein
MAVDTSRHFNDDSRYDAPDYLDGEEDLRIADAENRERIDAERADFLHDERIERGMK